MDVQHLQAAIEISIINRCGFYNGARVRFSGVVSSLSITATNDNDIKEARVIRYIRPTAVYDDDAVLLFTFYSAAADVEDALYDI